MSVPPSGYLKPLRISQLYEQIAERLREAILNGELRPGDRLPAERELAQQLEVSRASVREAIMSLQVQGLVETRVGAGSYVTPGAPTQLLERQRVEDETPDASPSALLEARRTFEPAFARLAAARTAQDPVAEALLADMDAAVESADTGTWNEADRLFHRQVAIMTANPVLAGIGEFIAQLMDEQLWRGLRDVALATPGWMPLHAAEHRMIYDAIVRGDGESSYFYAQQHIERVIRNLDSG